MKRSLFVLLLILAARCASGQISISTVQSGVSSPVGQIVSFGAAAAGWNVSDVVFNISYSGSASPYYLTYFNLQPGTAFSVLKSDWQALPVAIPATGLNFTIRFEPNQVAKTESANLEVGDAGNPLTIILSGEGTPGFTARLGKNALSAGGTIPFGSVQAGSTQTEVLALENGTGGPLLVGDISIQGADFALTGSSPAGATVPAGGSATVTISFHPAGSGTQTGTLTIGAATFQLSAVGLSPPPVSYPQPSIQLTPAGMGSAQQGGLAIHLASPAVTAGSGTVTLAFTPAIAGVRDDPTVTFADGTRTATFTVASGASSGRFANGASVAFGTGTTAGTLTFTVTLGANTAQSTLQIPAAAVSIDAAVAARNAACDPALAYCTTVNVQLQVNGWDNTRSISEVDFHFFDQNGNAIAPATLAFDATSPFETYFASSGLGGVFGLSAFFPITGDSNKVTAAIVTFTNSAGTVESAEISF